MKNTFNNIIILILLMNTVNSYTQNQNTLLQEVNNKPSTKAIISLNSTKASEWTLYYGIQDEGAPQSPQELLKSDYKKITATVPGNVEIDLEREGIIEDPMIGDNVYDLRKYETYQWWYKRNFKKPKIEAGERIELAFDGIDCIADIWLNGKKMASVENMFVEHHYDVTDILQEKNELYVNIKSTELEARNYLRNNFGMRYDQLGQAASVRKAPHMFGWDIMPRLMSAGIWKDVKLEIIPPTYFSSVYWVTKAVYPDAKKANLYIDWQFNTDRLNIDDLTMSFELERNGRMAYSAEVPVITTIGRERIWGLEDVDLWWPRGFGEGSLWQVSLTVSYSNSYEMYDFLLDLKMDNSDHQPDQICSKTLAERDVILQGQLLHQQNLKMCLARTHFPCCKTCPRGWKARPTRAGHVRVSDELAWSICPVSIVECRHVLA